MVDPWERQEGEPPKAYDAFARYRDLGAQRSFAKVIAREISNDGASDPPSKLQHRRRQFAVWSGCWRWVERCAAWDAEQDRTRRLALADAIRLAAERQAKIATAITAKGLAALAKLQPEAMSPRELLAYITAGISMERTALGMADRDDRDTADRDREALLTLDDISAVVREYRRADASIPPAKMEDDDDGV